VGERPEGMSGPELSSEQLCLQLNWGHTPWHGVSPRYLTKGALAGPCGVDNSSVGWQSREAQRFGTDPAQLTLFLQGKS